MNSSSVGVYICNSSKLINKFLYCLQSGSVLFFTYFFLFSMNVLHKSIWMCRTPIKKDKWNIEILSLSWQYKHLLINLLELTDEIDEIIMMSQINNYKSIWLNCKYGLCNCLYTSNLTTENVYFCKLFILLISTKTL